MGWVRAMGGATLDLGTPYGRVLMTSDRRAYERAVARCEVTFTPLELVPIVDAASNGVEVPWSALVALKRADPGARLQRVACDCGQCAASWTRPVGRRRTDR